MSLSRTEDSNVHVNERIGITFELRDNATGVMERCCVSRDALNTLATKDGDARDWNGAYIRYRDFIEAIASKIHDEAKPGRIIVVESRHLTDAMA